MTFLGVMLLYFGVFKTLHFIYTKMQNENFYWKLCWILLSFMNLAAALVCFGYGNEILIIKNHIYHAFIGTILLTFFIGGYYQNLQLTDISKRKKANKQLFSVFLAMVICVILEYI